MKQLAILAAITMALLLAYVLADSSISQKYVFDLLEQSAQHKYLGVPWPCQCNTYFAYVSHHDAVGGHMLNS